MATDLAGILADLQAETDELTELVTQAGPLAEVLPHPTSAAGWTVGDTLGHLWFFDREARRAATDPDEFSAGLADIGADPDGYMRRALDAAHALDARILPAWRNERTALIAALAAVPAGEKRPWYGPPMAPASSATARLMETWAHGQDIADGLGIVRRPTARLRHICHLGVRTLAFSYSVRGLPPPAGDVRVVLTPPDGGEPWVYGPAEAADTITGPALDFCLLVTQRRLPADLDLLIDGPLAQEWTSIAQAFAGAVSTTDPARSGLPVHR